MKSKKVYVGKRKIDLICLIMSISYLIAIILDIVGMSLYVNMCEATGIKPVGIDLAYYIFLLLILIAVWIITIYILLTISGNRKLIQDITVILNETEIMTKGIKKALKKKNFNFESYEFRNPFCDSDYDVSDIDEHYVISYCECGYQLFDCDKSCPNCGKKVANKKK